MTWRRREAGDSRGGLCFVAHGFPPVAHAAMRHAIVAGRSGKRLIQDAFAQVGVAPVPAVHRVILADRAAVQRVARAAPAFRDTAQAVWRRLPGTVGSSGFAALASGAEPIAWPNAPSIRLAGASCRRAPERRDDSSARRRARCCPERDGLGTHHGRASRAVHARNVGHGSRSCQGVIRLRKLMAWSPCRPPRYAARDGGRVAPMNDPADRAIPAAASSPSAFTQHAPEP